MLVGGDVTASTGSRAQKSFAVIGAVCACRFVSFVRFVSFGSSVFACVCVRQERRSSGVSVLCWLKKKKAVISGVEPVVAVEW